MRNKEVRLINDESAPRNKIPFVRILKNSFLKKFFREHPEWAYFQEQLSSDELKEAVRGFHKNLGQLSIDHRDGIHFPEQLGWVYMVSVAKAAKKVNEALSNKLGEHINHTSNSSDGRSLKIMYVNKHKSFNFENKDMWVFEPGVEFKKSASRQFAKNYMRYFPGGRTWEARQRKKEFYEREGIKPSDFKKRKYKKT